MTSTAHSYKGIFRSRQHPIKILSYTTRSFWLILIPLTRDFIASRYDIASWLYGSWLSILTIIVIFLYAFFRWYLVTYRIEDDCIVCRNGIFGLWETKLYFCAVSCVSSVQTPLNRIFRASTIYLCSHTSKRHAIKLTMKRSDTLRLFSRFKDERSAVFCFRPKKTHLAVFSLLFSSSLSGLILVATFVIQSSKLISKKLEQDIRLGLSELGSSVSTLPQSLEKISVIVMACFLSLMSLSFIANLLRHASFSVKKIGGRLFVESGLFTRRSHILSLELVTYCDIQQNLLMKLFRVCSVRIFCSGYGKHNRELNVLVPITTIDRVKSSLRLLLPNHRHTKADTPAIRKSPLSYVWLPLILEIIAVAVTILAYRLTFIVAGAIQLFLIISQVPIIWLFIARLVALFTTSIGYEDGILRLHICKLYRFHKISLPVEHLSGFLIKQSPFQKRKNRCTVKIYVATSTKNKFVAKSLPLDKVESIASKTGVFCQLR